MRSQTIGITGVVLPSNPTSCATNTLDISLIVGCINYPYINTVFTVTGNTINVAVNYSGGMICLGALSFPTHTETFPALAGGTYTVNVSTYLNNILEASHAPLSMVVTPCGPEASFLLDDTTICMPDSISATNTSLASNTYSWYYDGLFVSNDSNEVFFPNTPGQHTILLVASNGLQSDTFSQTITAFLPAPTISIGSDTAVCEGDSIILQINQPFTNVLWSNGSNASSINVGVGVYSVTVSEPETCEGSDTITISEIQLEDLQIITSGETNCDIGTLSASPGFFSYQWSNGATTSQISTSITGTYSVTATSVEGCAAFASDSIAVYASPTISIGADTTICHNAVWEMILSTNLEGTHIWSDSSSADTLLISGIFGNYWVTFTDSNGCFGSDTISIIEEFCPNLGNNDVFKGDEITVYPNPAKDVLQVYSPNNISQIDFYSSQGELVLSKPVLNNVTHSIDVSSLTKGIYFVAFKTSAKIFYNQIIILP